MTASWVSVMRLGILQVEMVPSGIAPAAGSPFFLIHEPPPCYPEIICHPERSEGSWFVPAPSAIATTRKNQGPSLRSG
jgi:hypothetical protein